MQSQINNCSVQVDKEIDNAVKKIQKAVRNMIARKNFRLSLYKNMLFKNIVENKVHKERM